MTQKALGVKKNYWANIDNQKQFFDNLYNTLKLNSLDDWYAVNTKIIHKFGGNGILSRYKGSKSKALQTVYPNYDWKITNWKQLPKNFWKDQNNIRNYIKEMELRLNIQKKEDWYSLPVYKVSKYLGTTRSLIHRDGLCKVLSIAYPEIDWDYGLFHKVPQGFWIDPKNQLSTIESIAKKLNIKKLDDWYNVKYLDIVKYGGRGVIRYYNGDKLAMLKAIYPEHDWDRSLASHLPHNYWRDSGNIIKYIDGIRQLFCIKNKEDWYRVSLQQIKSTKGGSIAKSGFFQALQHTYPDQKWDRDKIEMRDKRSDQRILKITIGKLFPHYHYYENYKFTSLLFEASGIAIEFDIFLPEINFAFEYQGQQHYNDMPGGFSSLEMITTRDQEKYHLCNINNIKIIQIPFWWDQSVDSLHTTIFCK